MSAYNVTVSIHPAAGPAAVGPAVAGPAIAGPAAAGPAIAGPPVQRPALRRPRVRNAGPARIGPIPRAQPALSNVAIVAFSIMHVFEIICIVIIFLYK